MKKVLVTGISGYVGVNFKKWVQDNNIDVELVYMSIKNDQWKFEEFSQYDAILHLAAIVHSSNVKKRDYYRINSDLTFEIAKKAKESGVRHFIFFSTLSVYGLEEGNIDRYTKTNPINDYGKSKLDAENRILSIQNEDSFKIAIVRSPLIYGSNAPGNFKKLLFIINVSPIFFKFKNRKSMIFIDNLSSFLYTLIANENNGIFIPQNEEYINTTTIYENIRAGQNKKTILIPIPLWLMKKLKNKSKLVTKIFGDLTVDNDYLNLPNEYKKLSFSETLNKIYKNK